jgi:predicted CoA-binding protein
VENLPVQNATQDEISDILRYYKTVAVIGMSKNPDKDAYKIPEYLMNNGFMVIPVNPSVDEILGQKAYKRLSDVPGPVDIVDVFRPSEDVPNYVVDVIEKNPKVFWEQLGIHNLEAEEKIAAAGIKIVYDRCMKVELRKTRAVR